MSALQKYVIVYDIADGKRWRKVYSLLKNYGYRVQYSVFEVQVTEKDMLLLRTTLKSFIKEKEDSVIFYKQCGRCVKDEMRMGKQYSPFEDEDFYFV